MRIRHVATAEVTNIGETIKTANRYAIKKSSESQKRIMENSYPDVFSPTGIPFRVKYDGIETIRDKGFVTELLNLFSFFTFPIIEHSEKRFKFNIEFDSVRLDGSKVSFYETQDFLGGLFSPFGLLIPQDPPAPSSKRFFYKMHHVALNSSAVRSANAEVNQRAMAYAVAVRLKELEDMGRIKDSIGTVPQSVSDSKLTPKPQSVSAYKIISCERESGNAFAYRFVLELKGESGDPLLMFRTIQQRFRQAVKEDYLESFPSVKSNSLYVDFTEYKLNNGKIEGRAVVLTISVTSLTYDPSTRTGKLAVKVNANQYEEARKWVRKNIETLARDKNIALVTGEIPPAAKFYLGREELKDGNILELEFKTE